MLAPLDHRLRLELLLYSIKLFLFYNGGVKAFIDFTLMSDLTYVDGIDQNVVYPPGSSFSLARAYLPRALLCSDTQALHRDHRHAEYQRIAPHISRETVSLDQSEPYSPRGPYPPSTCLSSWRPRSIANALCSNFALKLGKREAHSVSVVP